MADAAALAHMLFEDVVTMSWRCPNNRNHETPHDATTVGDDGRGMPIHTIRVEFLARLLPRIHPSFWWDLILDREISTASDK
jgi:hypothetical protein